MVRLRIDTDDPVLSECMKLIGTTDPAVAITDALEAVRSSEKRRAEVKAEYEALKKVRGAREL